MPNLGASQVGSLLRRLLDLRRQLESLEELADEEERERLQAVCDTVGARGESSGA